MELGAERRDQVEDLGLDGRVERGRRLVEDQQRRLGGERHRDHHALEHAARELVRIAVHHPGRIGDPDLLEHLLRAVEGLPLRDTCDLEHLGHLATDPDRRVQRPAGLLVDHRDRVLAELAQLALVQREHVASVHLDLAAGHLAVARQVADDPERDRRLAAARLAHEAERLASPDPEADVAHHAHRPSADSVGDLEALDVQRVRLWKRLALPRACQPSCSSLECSLHRIGDQRDRHHQRRDRERVEQHLPPVAGRHDAVVRRDVERPVG